MTAYQVLRRQRTGPKKYETSRSRMLAMMVGLLV